MRAIKFRCWDLEDEKWVSENILIDWNGTLSFASERELYVIDDDDRYEVQMYTGLKDKNGKEIYEGDVVRASIYCDEDAQILEVKYEGAGFVIDYRDADSDYCLLSDFPSSVEVIGNIYEHPDLLK